MFYNKITICGDIVHKERLAHSKNGIPYLKMTIRTEDAYRKNNVCDFSIMCFNRVAENCTTYLQEGDNIIVEGGLSNQEQKNQSGNSIFKYTIIGTYIVFPNKNKSQKIYVNSQSQEPNMTPEEVAMYFGVSNNSYAQPYEPNMKKNPKEAIEEDLEWEKNTFGRSSDNDVKTYNLKDNKENNKEDIDSYFTNPNESNKDNNNEIQGDKDNKDDKDNKTSNISRPSEDIDSPNPYKYRDQDNNYSFIDKNGTEYIEF